MKNTTTHRAEKLGMFLIEGPVQSLKIGHGTLNLLCPMQNSAQTAAGVMGVATDHLGATASSVMVQLYEGEDVEMFACFIGDQLVQGCFSQVMFQNGDEVKAVVTTRPNEEAVTCYAVLNPRDGLLSMPYDTGRGVWAELKKNFRWAGRIGIFCMVLFCIQLLIMDWEWVTFAMLLAADILVLIVMALWAFFAESEGDVSTGIFEVLGLPRPMSLDLKPSAICPHEGYGGAYGIFRYRRIVTASEDPHGSPEPEPLKPWHLAYAEKNGLDVNAMRNKKN